MYINTFKYTPKDVSCQLCTEYVKKLGCTALRCPWLAERIEAGVVGYREAVLETFPHERRLFQRLNLLIKHYPGSLWSNEQHERRMQYQCAVQGYRRRRDTNAYYAAMYLLTSNDDIYRRTANCFCKDGIEFGYDCTVSATALYLLKTLTENHIIHEDNQILPCCGHFYVPDKELQNVYISGCDNGIDWTVKHNGSDVILVLENGTEVSVPLEEYQQEVYRFADKIENYYKSCSPKIIPEDKFKRDGYIAFWNEWHRRRNT